MIKCSYPYLVQQNDEPRKANYVPDWVVVGFPLVDASHGDEQDTGLTLQGKVEGSAENLLV